MPSSRSRQRPSPSLGFDAIGTRWQVDTALPLPADVVAAIEDRAESYDRTWSRFRDDSLVHRIATAPGIFEFPPEAPALFDLYRALYECTDGSVTPLVGRALEQWGYDSAYTLRPSGTVSPVPRWEDAFTWNGRTLETARPVVIDVGAAGKGHLVDLVAEHLLSAGIEEFTIDASGDIVHRGATPLRVALEHPLDTRKAIGVARLAGGALCASASNRRVWPGAHHVIDALTGLPTRNVIATWVVASSGLVADGLATALFFAEPARLEGRFEFECVRMFADARVETSAGFEGEMFA